MAERRLTVRPGALAVRVAVQPALWIGILYLAARAVTTAFLILAGSLSTPSSRFGDAPALGDLVVGWDARWYWIIAVVGYPTTLPLTDDGLVAENAWAFLPVYPFLAQTVSLPFGHWAAGALLVSLVAGYAACYVLYRLLRTRLSVIASTWAVVFFACGPLAALFQVGYAETLNLLWLFLALWALIRRRWGWLYVLIPLMGFTRPGILAFSLMLALYGIWRWVQRKRDPLPVREIIHIIATGLLAAAVGFAWQIIAAVVTGRSDAYLATELAWRRIWMPGEADFVPLHGFLEAVEFWFGRMWQVDPLVGYVLLVALVAAIAALLLWAKPVRALGVEIRLWSVGYIVYLLLVFFPQSSIFRLLVPLSPLWGAFAVPRSRIWRWSVLAACLVGQWWWIYNMYGLGNMTWQVP